METSRIVYGSLVSPFVRKVLITLDIKSLAYENQVLIPFIPEHKQKIFELNPFGTIPVYQENDFKIADSSVICAYLEKQYPAYPIYPSNAQDYAKCLWYEEYADAKLIPAILPVFFHTVLATKFNVEPDHKAVEVALTKLLPQIFDYLDKEIGTKAFLVGDIFSLADISMAVGFVNFEIAGHKVDAVRWENLARYIEGVSQEPHFANFAAQAKARLMPRDK